jgi:hypothetical protein
MAVASDRDPSAFAQVVKESLRTAQQQTSGLRRTNTRLMVASTVSSAITTLVAGGVAAVGPMVKLEDASWSLACIVAAVFAFASTICTTLTQQMKVGERIVQGNQCVGRLRSLDVAIATGVRSWEEITKEYGEIAQSYSEFIG